VDCVSCACSRGIARHFKLPSFQPAIAVFAMNGRVITSCTPGTFCMRQPKRSMAVMKS